MHIIIVKIEKNFRTLLLFPSVPVNQRNSNRVLVCNSMRDAYHRYNDTLSMTIFSSM